MCVAIVQVSCWHNAATPAECPPGPTERTKKKIGRIMKIITYVVSHVETHLTFNTSYPLTRYSCRGFVQCFCLAGVYRIIYCVPIFAHSSWHASAPEERLEWQYHRSDYMSVFTSVALHSDTLQNILIQWDIENLIKSAIWLTLWTIQSTLLLHLWTDNIGEMTENWRTAR